MHTVTQKSLCCQALSFNAMMNLKYILMHGSVETDWAGS